MSLDDQKRTLPHKARVSEFDAYELAAHITGTTREYEGNGDEDALEAELLDQYEVDFCTFVELVRVLLPMAATLTSAITGHLHHCFAITNAHGKSRALVKSEPIDPKNQANYTAK